MVPRSSESWEKTTPIEANHVAAWKAGCRRQNGDVFPKKRKSLGFDQFCSSTIGKQMRTGEKQFARDRTKKRVSD
jgi:hypothetical protein